ncbi:uncharacterized protein LOC111080631 [Drosophila obscura]|uniref:uncharacterized protein LOC111080631 n=1 Tax=Drosophila obscura TaxID=7282 RepID=UPI001BB196D1|nr:uncharacterized protein LOC111080631 [Drosophila obscura]
MGRYISSNEAVWRILSFPIHDRHPTVVHLAVHLENGQRVFFTPGNAMRRAAQPPATTLTAFFSLCQADDFAKTLLSAEVPEYYMWNNSSKVFQRRRRGKAVHGQPVLFHSDAIGRIYTVHPNNQECYYLRLLLNVRAPTSFESLRTVDEELCGTYREACERLNMLENDIHWDLTLEDAALSSSPHQIRTLFATIIATCSPAKPIELWQKHQNHLSEDFLHRLRRQTGDINVDYTPEIYNEALIAIEDLCLMMASKALAQLGMTAPNRDIHDLFNKELEREQQYDRAELNAFVQNNEPRLNINQRTVYDQILRAIEEQHGGLFFWMQLEVPEKREEYVPVDSSTPLFIQFA